MTAAGDGDEEYYMAMQMADLGGARADEIRTEVDDNVQPVDLKAVRAASAANQEGTEERRVYEDNQGRIDLWKGLAEGGFAAPENRDISEGQSHRLRLLRGDHDDNRRRGNGRSGRGDRGSANGRGGGIAGTRGRGDLVPRSINNSGDVRQADPNPPPVYRGARRILELSRDLSVPTYQPTNRHALGTPTVESARRHAVPPIVDGIGKSRTGHGPSLHGAIDPSARLHKIFALGSEDEVRDAFSRAANIDRQEVSQMPSTALSNTLDHAPAVRISHETVPTATMADETKNNDQLDIFSPEIDLAPEGNRVPTPSPKENHALSSGLSNVSGASYMNDLVGLTFNHQHMLEVPGRQHEAGPQTARSAGKLIDFSAEEEPEAKMDGSVRCESLLKSDSVSSLISEAKAGAAKPLSTTGRDATPRSGGRSGVDQSVDEVKKLQDYLGYLEGIHKDVKPDDLIYPVLQTLRTRLRQLKQEQTIAETAGTEKPTGEDGQQASQSHQHDDTTLETNLSHAIEEENQGERYEMQTPDRGILEAPQHSSSSDTEQPAHGNVTPLLTDEQNLSNSARTIVREGAESVTSEQVLTPRLGGSYGDDQSGNRYAPSMSTIRASSIIGDHNLYRRSEARRQQGSMSSVSTTMSYHTAVPDTSDLRHQLNGVMLRGRGESRFEQAGDREPLLSRPGSAASTSDPLQPWSGSQFDARAPDVRPVSLSDFPPRLNRNTPVADPAVSHDMPHLNALGTNVSRASGVTSSALLPVPGLTGSLWGQCAEPQSQMPHPNAPSMSLAGALGATSSSLPPVARLAGSMWSSPREHVQNSTTLIELLPSDIEGSTSIAGNRSLERSGTQSGSGDTTASPSRHFGGEVSPHGFNAHLHQRAQSSGRLIRPPPSISRTNDPTFRKYHSTRRPDHKLPAFIADFANGK